jgi:PAT family beta-lactamase induction signal transducer AmpG
VTVAATTRGRLSLFTGLYFAQGVPWGFFTIAIMLRLAGQGLGPAALGEISSMAWLPWAGKPLLGPLVDRISFGRFGRRRPYILFAELGMALSLLALSLADPTTNLSLFGALLFVHNACAAAQDVGTDALAIDLLAADERGRANGFMSAGKFLGMLVGGQGLLLVARLAGWGVAFGVAIVLLLVPAVLVLSVQEPPARPESPRLARDLVRLFSDRRVLLAALFAAVANASASLVFPLTYPLFTRRLHFSEQQIATLATVGGAVAALAAVGGGLLSDRVGRRRAIVIGGLGVAGFDVVFALCHGLWGNYAFQLVFGAASAVADGIVYASLLALFMDLTHPRLAATHFQISMALTNLRGVWGGRSGGRLAERIAPTTMYGLAAVVEALPLLLLLWLDPRRGTARADRDGGPR